MNSMKAVIWKKYGQPEGMVLKTVEKPIQGENEILVKIHATTVTAGDCEMRRLELPLMLSFPMRLYAGLVRPKRILILGQELAGEVVAVGSQVKTWKKGDQVFGTTGFRFGAYAQFICLPADPGDAQGVLASKPINVTYEEAACIPTAGLEALHFFRSANIQSGKKVLIIGGGGSIGTFTIQLATLFGAQVTAVDITEKMEMMRALGAVRVIDYTKENYIKERETYDLIIDLVGRSSVRRRLKLLKSDGTYFIAFASLSHILLGKLISLTSKKKIKVESSKQRKEDLEYLKDLIELSKINPVVGCSFPLEEMVAAHRFAESGQKIGNIVIKVEHSSSA